MPLSGSQLLFWVICNNRLRSIIWGPREGERKKEALKVNSKSSKPILKHAGSQYKEAKPGGMWSLLFDLDKKLTAEIGTT